MPIRVAVPSETRTDERRVALVPDIAARLVKQGYEVCVEQGAAAPAHFTDDDYTRADARIIADKHQLYAESDIILKVQPPQEEELELLRPESTVIGFMTPHRETAMVARLRDKRITAFAIELLPRITRAQAMDALSSQATVAGYKAALMGADMCSRFWPMLTTAAGTIRPAKVLVLGAGVAGLQAIATARRLGALVEAYDVRRATREQVESLGAKFLALEVDAEASGGYARELSDEEKQQEQELLRNGIAGADVVITTAQIPGRPAPRLIDAGMVAAMKSGAVIIDMAAESGGNCELTQARETVIHHDVVIHGPVNIPSMLPVDASEMYARNLFNFLTLLTHDGESMEFDWQDEIIDGSALTHQGEVRHAPTRDLLEGGQG